MRTPREFGQRRILQIAEQILWIDEMVAGVDFAIVLEDDRIAAFLGIDADRPALSDPNAIVAATVVIPLPAFKRHLVRQLPVPVGS